VKPGVGCEQVARPAKLTPEIEYQICQLVRAGNSVEIAASASGISAPTYYRWMERGIREQSGPYADFREAVDRARAEVEGRLVAGDQASANDWRASAWRLERMRPERWARSSERRARTSPVLDRELERLDER
jgi:hypothetical protein